MNYPFWKVSVYVSSYCIYTGHDQFVSSFDDFYIMSCNFQIELSDSEIHISSKIKFILNLSLLTNPPSNSL